MSTLQKTLEIVNAKGLHVRAATALVNTAKQFDATISIEHAGERANAKSVMNLLLLTAPVGATVRVVVQGEDAEPAMEAVAALIARGFGE